MTWQGTGGTGGTGGSPEDPEDATRTDWNLGTTPPGQPGDPSGPVPGEPTSPFAPGGPLADDEGLPPASRPVDAPPPSPAPIVPPPVSMAAPPAAPGGAPWAPPEQAPGGGWGAPPVGGPSQYSVPGAPGLIYAGAIPRAAAYLVDSLLVGIVASIVAAPFASQAIFDPENPAAFATTGGVSSIVTAALSAAYFIFLWSSSGRATLGMRLFQLQLGNAADGNKLEPVQAAKRWLAFGSFLGLLGFAPALAALAGLAQLVWFVVLLVTTVSSPTKQGLHDQFAGSAMVRPAAAGSGLAIACLAVALLLPFLLILLLIPLIFLGGQVSEILSAVGDSV